MRLSFQLEYFGDCDKVVSFYASVFRNASLKVKNFREMDMADALGITGAGLAMVWQSELCIPCGDTVLCMEMSDSLLAAMQKPLDFSQPFYNPVISISPDDESRMRSLYQKLYEGGESFETLRNGTVTDSHGIRWQYGSENSCGIFYCLTFDGFCSDVIAFYEKVFQIKAAEVIKYRDAPGGDTIPAAGADKIYSALLQFCHGGHTYALKVGDSHASAMDGGNSYDPNALLFYQGLYNPLFIVRDSDTAYLSGAFQRLTEGAKLNRPLMPDSKGVLYGSLIDKYGICWNFYSAME